MSGGSLLAVGLFAISAAILHSPGKVAVTLLRARWLLIAAFAVFAFSGPGEALFGGAPRWSPTWEGLEAGVTHVFRLTAALASLAALLAWLSREELLSAVFVLARPLRFLGMDPLRLAARLSLVLRFAETPPHAGRGLRDLFDAPVTDPDEAVRLSLASLRTQDALVLILAWAGVLAL